MKLFVKYAEKKNYIFSYLEKKITYVVRFEKKKVLCIILLVYCFEYFMFLLYL